MRKLIFDCGCDGTAVAKVTSSEVIVSSSQIISNAKQTAFVVGTGLEGFGSSISVVDCYHISSTSVVLLPLVSTSACPPTPSRDLSSTKTHSPDTILPFLSVSGVGLRLSDVELILGTGPLLDFGKLTKSFDRSETTDKGGISTVLVGSVLRNVTSPGCSPEQLVLPRGLSQKLVGTSVTRCTSHLYGTGCLDINAFGSVRCLNTSFSHCSSNIDFSDQITHKHFKDDGRYEYTEDTTQISLTFHLCTFTSMTSTTEGACVYVYADYDITISECSFKDIQGYKGGSLCICGKAKQESMRISLCSFLNCISQDYGAALYNQLASFLSVNKCVFKNMITTIPLAYGGAVSVHKTTLSIITDCVFMDCTCSAPEAFGGALFVEISTLRLTSVQFRGNSALNGDDLYLASGCGSPSELKGRVSDCHTDKPGPSVMMKGYETPTGIIEEFGTATVITNLQLTLCPTASEGTIEVETAGEVKGTMLLLLDNTKPEESNSEDSPPATCRVVVVNFPTPSKTGTSDVLSFGDDQRLQSPSPYSLLAASISATPIDVDSSPSLTIGPNHVRKLLYQPGTNIGEMLVWLEGYKLEVGEYTVTFEGTPSLSLNISFSTDQASSDSRVSLSVSVGPGGTDTRFSFGETYKVEKITFNNQPVLLESGGFSLVLPPFPKPFVFEVNEKKGGDDGSCRGLDNSCGSLEAAFETAAKIGMKPTTLKLVNSEKLSKTRTISDKNEVSMTNGSLDRPSLIVPATFSSNPLVVISVSNASLSLTAVDALIHSSSLDLKLVVVTAGFFKFSDGAISFDSSSTSNSKIRTSNNDLQASDLIPVIPALTSIDPSFTYFDGTTQMPDDLCSWTTGTIEIVNSTAEFSKCNLTNLAQGAIIQSGGKVTLEEVNFLSNGPSNKEFPSARRNVMCSSDGALIVGGLTGDGRSRDFPGSGISAEACDVSGTATTMSIPFLDASQSKITHDKETENFELELVGSGFMPCGLEVEVYTDSEDKNSEEVSIALIVDTDTASLFTETRIEFIVTPNDVANLSKKLEWKVRLLNGNRSIGTSHLVLREKPRSLIWLIPVIVVVVVVITVVIVALLLIWRCRHQKRVEKKDEMIKTADEVAPTVTEPASDRPETESAVDPAINVSDMPAEMTEENTKESCSSPERKIEE
ncbi:hypothetical protein BLNAU_14223 [Blattamonas nauphoetae]|uniref:Uncharacterized protein n=1 Tax=Blattamonas nauphoetae TaxID=2049346 RepID=A0ABQ9XHY3_9EUKA|nr:hypothetical protein BLNAU_14223 [Blattamonas nauphoetae]